MDISKTKQEQSAGENSSQNQLIGDNSNQTNVQSVNITYNGMSLEEIVDFTTTVSNQVTKKTLSLCTEVAEETAIKRMKDFEKIWIPRLSKIEDAIKHLMDPKFQFMIGDAQKTAVKSTRSDDLEMLSELLACHIEKGDDLKVDAGISRAINIVNEVDSDSLCALTVAVTILNIIPTDGNSVEAALEELDDIYSKLLLTELPNGFNWIDHLNVLGAINLMTGNFHNSKRLFADHFNGYICVGIKDGSDEHSQANRIIKDSGLISTSLVPNECLPGYLRLPIVEKNSLDEALRPILDLYSKDKELLGTANNNFIEMWDSYETLRIIREWFDRLPAAFRINSVGYALAHTFAKRCYPDYPDLV